MKTILIAVALLSGCFMQDVSGMYLRQADAEGQKNLPVETADGMDALLFEFPKKNDHKKEEAKEAGKEAKTDDDADAPLFPFLVIKDDKMVVAKDARKVDEKELKTVNKESDHKDDRMEDKVYFLESVEKMHDKKADKKEVLKQMAPAATAPDAIKSPAAPAVTAPKDIESPGAKEILKQMAAAAPAVTAPPAAPAVKAIESPAAPAVTAPKDIESPAAKEILKQMAAAAPAPKAIESPAAPAVKAPKDIESPSASARGTKEGASPAAEATDKNEDEKRDKTHRTNMIVRSSQVADLHTVTNDFDMNQVVFHIWQDPSVGIYYINSTKQSYLHADAVDGCVADAEQFLGPGTSKPVTQQKAMELADSSCKRKVPGNSGACKAYHETLVAAFSAETNNKRLYTALQFCVVVEYWKMMNFELAPDKSPAIFHYIIGFAQVLGMILVLAVALAVKFSAIVMPCFVGAIPKIMMPDSG